MEKKKLDVVTLTFHQSDNYGAVLQAYALQTKIRKLGYSTQILNYFSEGVNFWNKKITFKTDGYNLRTFKSIIWQFLRRHKHANFDHFRSYLELTEPYFDTTISNAGNIAGVYIVGSDQVWNCDCTFEDYHYFLDFVEDDFKKNSYAASFGYSSIPKKYVESCKKHLCRFNKITVREENGIDIVKRTCDLQATMVVDPVMLLSSEEWKNVMTPVAGKYIFVYQAEKSPSLIQFANSLAKSRKCKLFIVSSVFKGTYGKNTKSFSDKGPDIFLGLISGAECVVTNSFHGTALSILFNTEFYVESLKHNNTNSRVSSILKTFNLENRMNDMSLPIETTQIDYTNVNKILQRLQKESESVLLDMIHAESK